MDTEDTRESELIARLRRLDAIATEAVPDFGYQGLVERHAAKLVRARRRLAYARGTASALVFALVGVSVWRFYQPPAKPVVLTESAPAEAAPAMQPRIVRADTYLALAALEDHIASLDDALNDARLRNGGADVARLERTRAELLDSYVQVRYAERVSANF